MPRHKTPDNIVLYNKWLNNGPPKCCHTCDWYNDRGLCEMHGSEPPEEFAASDGACKDWVREIPF